MKAVSCSQGQVMHLQKHQERIRNMCILAHVDHGKTTLADSLVASNGIISTKMAGKLRYMDSRKDEQERGITMKSSSITLLHKHNDVDYIINMIDSPGHVDFSSEVSTAVRLCDGAIVVIDVVEGVCPQTKVVLHQAWQENIKPVLFLNKLDRLILELSLSPLDAYVRITQVLEQVNVIMGELFTTDVFAKSDATVKLDDESDTYDWSTGIEDIEDEHLYFSPQQGNVIFGSAYDGWGFTIEDFAKLYATKLGVSEKVLIKTLWGDFYLHSKTKRIFKGAQMKAKKPLFVHFILENIWSLYDVIMVRKDKDKLMKIVDSLGIKLTARDARHTDPRVHLQAVCSQWMGLSSKVLDIVCMKLPSPKELTEERVERLISADFNCLPEDSKSLKKYFLSCDFNENVPTIAFISKMFHIEKNVLPENKPKPLTQEELSKRREAARARHAENLVKKEESDIIESEDKQVDVSEVVKEEKDDYFIAFARVFSGTLKEGQELYVLGPKHDPSKVLLQTTEEVVGTKLSELKPGQYVTKTTISKLYTLMGRELLPLQEAVAGNVIGIGGLEEHVLKTATLSTTLACPAFSELTELVVPILRVAVEPKHPYDMQSLVQGLKLLNLADPAVQVFIQETGEHVIVTAGEVHLQRCLDDLKNRYSKVEINVSEPIVPFRETIITTPKLDMVNEAVADQQQPSIKGEEVNELITIHTSNKQCTITIKAVPVPNEVTSLLEKMSDTIRFVDQFVISGSNYLPETKILEDERLVKLKTELTEVFKNVGPEWDDLVENIWCFGPRRCGPNILINRIPGYGSSVWKGRDIKSTLSEYENSFCNGFQIASLAGPLCEEPMMGVAFVVESWEIVEGAPGLSSSYGPLSGQIMSAVKDGCRRAFQAQPQRLMAAMYSCSIQVNTEALGKMYAVLGRRHGRVLHGDMTQGSSSFDITAVLPVVESFNFAQEIRKQTSGLANPQLVFSHWEVIDIDPFWTPKTEEEYLHFGEKADSENRARKYVNMVRKRKGLAVEEKIVEFAEKQRTLSKKK